MPDPIYSEKYVPNEYFGQRTDRVLAQLFPEFSRSQLSNWLKDGLITLNDKYHKPKDKVVGGELIKIQGLLIASQVEALPEAIPLAIVFEDDELLVVNKQAGLVVHPGAGNWQHTLVNALLHHAPILQALPRAGIIHRLDKETTGLLIIAKTLAAHTNLIRKMQDREIQRSYLALVHGKVSSDGVIDTFYGRHPRNRLKMAVCAQGKQAITHYAIKKRYPGFTLLNVKLMTGRTHQIRVHMAHINHPIVGDPLYCTRMSYSPYSGELKDTLHHFQRQALHAQHLSFKHPLNEEQLTLEAPIPQDFLTLLTSLDEIVE